MRFIKKSLQHYTTFNSGIDIGVLSI